MKQNLSDPVIDEIREVRHRISARFDHDSTRLVAHYIELQKEHQHRLIESGKRTNQSAAQPGAPADRPKAAGR